QLIIFSNYENLAKEYLTNIDAKIKLQEMIEKDDVKNIYQHIVKHNFLQYDEGFLKYNQIFLDAVDKAYICVDKKDIQKGVKFIQKYIGIKTLKPKIDNIFKFGYIRQIDEAEVGSYDIIKSISIYKKLFGLDEHIKEFLKDKGFKKELETLRELDVDMDVKPYPDSILTI
ncbi:MAG: hypothetical protein JXQ66_07555, partial [Campylobacterales bacterium]|nr:hypothetical protein [Campylobacterales bacterium]